MRSIYFTFAALFAVATSYAKSAIPEIKIPSSFKLAGSLNTWDGVKLTSVQGVNGSLFVDSQRNQLMIHQKVEVALFGLVDAKVLLDFTTGEALTHIPFLSVCQLDKTAKALDLAEEITRFNDKSYDLSKYLGLISAPWDQSSTTHKFVTKDTVEDYEIMGETYYEQDTLALKWLAFKNYVIAIDKNGVQATTFTDADFKFVGCNRQIADAQLVARQSAIVEEEELEVEGPNEDAKAAADNAKKAAQKAKAAAEKLQKISKEANAATKKASDSVKKAKAESIKAQQAAKAAKEAAKKAQEEAKKSKESIKKFNDAVKEAKAAAQEAKNAAKKASDSIKNIKK